MASRRIGSSLRIVHMAPLVPLLLVAIIAAEAIRDNSFLWHIRAGAIQLSDARVITEDPFSLAFAGESWRTQSWLIELLYATLEGGFDGLAWANIMVFVLGSTTALLIGLAAYRSTRSPIVTGLVMVVAVWLSGPFLQPRPVIASYVALAALVLVLQNRDRMLWLLVPIFWIWAGIHGSWIIGGGFLMLEWLRTSDRRLFRAGIAALTAVLLTAHGLGVWQVLVDFAGAQGALALLDEWLPPDFGAVMQAPYLLVIAGVIAAAIRGRIKMRDLIVVLPFLFFGLTSRRAVFPAAIVLMPWAALGLPTLKPSKSTNSVVVSWVAIGVVGLVALMPLFARPLGTIDNERFPTETIQRAMVGRSVFHDDVVGGFLIYSEWPERYVFVDDRAELYGEEHFRAFTAARDGSYEGLFEEFGIDAALTRDEWGLTERLDTDGWVRVVEDGGLVLFYQPGG